MSKVTLILDPGYGAKLVDLSRSQSIWIIDSKSNSAAAQQARSDSGSDITTFSFNRAKTAEGGLEEILFTIDEHIEWNELEVIGVVLNDQIKEMFRLEFNAKKFDSTSQGFILFRD